MCLVFALGTPFALGIITIYLKIQSKKISLFFFFFATTCLWILTKEMQTRKTKWKNKQCMWRKWKWNPILINYLSEKKCEWHKFWLKVKGTGLGIVECNVTHLFNVDCSKMLKPNGPSRGDIAKFL